ncbi:MAG: tRNA 2-selenouridine(34) synthase MnmH [Flavisolibacter sp.]
MPVEKIFIKEFIKGFRDCLLLDVRSPQEFSHGHVPGASNLPIFTDAERKAVGIAYKQKSREIAIKDGLDLFGPKMRGMVEQVEGLMEQHHFNPKQAVYIYCWRGGMRSAGVAWLLNLYGFNIYTLIGGYKAFRNHALQVFDQKFDFKIIGGFTGSGKTKMLEYLDKKGNRVIDLEMLASHKGSAFGGLNMPPQPTQEMFENNLATALLELKIPAFDQPTTIWLEDESQRIGNCNIPSPLWRTMRSAHVYFFEIPFEERLLHIMQEYGDVDTMQLKEGVTRIKKRLGGLDSKNSVAYLEGGNIKEAFRILLRYYDKQYLKGLHNRDLTTAPVKIITCATVTLDNAQRLIEIKQVP